MRKKLDLVREAQKQIFEVNLVNEITARGWTQSDLARRASDHMPGGKVGRDNVSNWCAGKAILMPKNLRAVALALGVSEGTFVPSVGAPAEDVVETAEGAELRPLDGERAWLRVDTIVPIEVARRILSEVHAAHLAEQIRILLEPGDSEQASFACPVELGHVAECGPSLGHVLLGAVFLDLPGAIASTVGIEREGGSGSDRADLGPGGARRGILLGESENSPCVGRLFLDARQAESSVRRRSPSAPAGADRARAAQRGRSLRDFGTGRSRSRSWRR